jgi:hypothetical protein
VAWEHRGVTTRAQRTWSGDGHWPISENAVEVPLLTVLCSVFAVHVERVEDGERRIDALQVVFHLLVASRAFSFVALHMHRLYIISCVSARRANKAVLLYL